MQSRPCCHGENTTCSSSCDQTVDIIILWMTNSENHGKDTNNSYMFTHVNSCHPSFFFNGSVYLKTNNPRGANESFTNIKIKLTAMLIVVSAFSQRHAANLGIKAIFI